MEMKDRIALLKEKHKLTTEALSAKSGVPAGTINKILNGETPNPRLDTSKALARALECSLDYLTGETDEEPGDASLKSDSEADKIGRDENGILDALKNDPATRMLAKISGDLTEEGKKDLLKYAEYLKSQRDRGWDD